MDLDEECRERATEAQQMADQARTEHAKASWLQIAEAWLRLIRTPVKKLNAKG